MANIARVQGTLTADLHAGAPVNDLTDSAAAVAAWLREQIITSHDSDDVTITQIDTGGHTARIVLDATTSTTADYREHLAIAATYLTGELVVTDDGGRVTKHVLGDGEVIDRVGRIVFADEQLVTQDQVSAVINDVVSEIDDVADLPCSGTIDALNLAVNATLWRLFTDSDASLDDIVAQCYELDGDDDCDGLDQVVAWINE